MPNGDRMSVFDLAVEFDICPRNQLSEPAGEYLTSGRLRQRLRIFVSQSQKEDEEFIHCGIVVSRHVCSGCL